MAKRIKLTVEFDVDEIPGATILASYAAPRWHMNRRSSSYGLHVIAVDNGKLYHFDRSFNPKRDDWVGEPLDITLEHHINLLKDLGLMETIKNDYKEIYLDIWSADPP